MRSAIPLLLVLVIPGIAAPPTRARSVMAQECLVERLARGDALPAVVTTTTWERARESRERRHRVTAAEREILGRLAVAQRESDPGPFREALRGGSPWIAAEALAGIVYGRLGRGYDAAFSPMGASRAEDLAFVEGLLPEIAESALASPARVGASTMGPVPTIAVECLTLLAARTPRAAVRREALDTVARSIARYPHWRSLDALLDLVEGQPASTVSETDRAPLIASLLEVAGERDHAGSLRAERLLGWLRSPEGLDLVAARQVEEPHVWRVLALAEGGDPRASRHLLDALDAVPADEPRASPPHALRAPAAPTYLALLARAVVHVRSAAAVEALLAMLERIGYLGPGIGDALLDIGGESVSAALRRLLRDAVRRAQAPSAGAFASLLLRLEPEAGERLRGRLPDYAPPTRRAILLALASRGAAHADMVRDVLRADRVDLATWREAVSALGEGWHAGDERALARLLEEWTWLEAGAPGGGFEAARGLPLVVAAVGEHQVPPAVEARLHRAWHTHESDSGLAQFLVQVLGQAGSRASLPLLASVSDYPDPARTSSTQQRRAAGIRVEARVAVGRIEQRLGLR